MPLHRLVCLHVHLGLCRALGAVERIAVDLTFLLVLKGSEREKGPLKSVAEIIKLTAMAQKLHRKDSPYGQEEHHHYKPHFA